MASKVDNWVACDLRYVGENKLARLHDDELVKLHDLLVKKHSLVHEPLSGGRDNNINSILALKKQIARSDVSDVSAAVPVSLPVPMPMPALASVTVPHEEHQAQASSEQEGEGEGEGEQEKKKAPPAMMTVEEKLTEAAKAFGAIFGKEEEGEEKEDEAKEEEEQTSEPVVVGSTPPEVLSKEEEAAKMDREARVSAFVQLAAAARPPSPKEDDEATNTKETDDAITVDTHHRMRVCSFNACKMRLGSANKAYIEVGDDGTCEEYEGTHKGAELAKKWLTLAALMADFDVILLQEVPGTERIMDQKIETFASMLDIATEDGREWSAINSQKSGKDGKVVGPSAEVHLCFVKSPVQFKGWNTLRKVGATELDYAPLQVLLHDPRFTDPADRDFVITSVHLPPSKRVDARDSQIAALLRNYSAPDTSEYRMQQPFKPSKDVKLAPTHVLAGDFNTYPGNEQYNMLGSGFVSKIPKNASTTSGHQNYDNVLVDTHANDRFLIGGGIMQLKDPHNAAKGEVGISDHYPVFVELREVQKTGKQPATTLPVVESELVEEGREPPPLESVPEPPPPLVLEPVPEELEVPKVPEEPQPPLIEAPMAIWDRLSEEAKTSNPNYDLDQTKPECTDDSEKDSEVLTDDGLALDLPRVVHDEPAEEEVVRGVVEEAMERIMKGVLDTATTSAEAPLPPESSTEAAPPLAPRLAPAPPPDSPPTQPPEGGPTEEELVAWRETIAQPLPTPDPSPSPPTEEPSTPSPPPPTTEDATEASAPTPAPLVEVD